MGQAVATLADFEVNPSVRAQTCKLVFVDELVGDVQDFDASLFGLRHGGIKVEVLEINGAKAGTFSREYTVEEELEKLQQCGVSTHIAGVADAVATNGDLCAVRAVLVQTDFACDHGMAYFFSLVQRDVVVVDAKERVGTGYTLGAGAPPLKSTEGNIFGMYAAEINFAIFANCYYNQPSFSSGGSRKLLPQPTTTNNKHHNHDGDVCPSGSVVLIDLLIQKDGRPSKGDGRGCC